MIGCIGGIVGVGLVTDQPAGGPEVLTCPRAAGRRARGPRARQRRGRRRAETSSGCGAVAVGAVWTLHPTKSKLSLLYSAGRGGIGGVFI